MCWCRRCCSKFICFLVYVTRLHVRGRLVSILQSIGAAGLGTLGTSISSSFGAAIGTLIGAIGGPKACNIFKRNQIFGRFDFKENNYQN
ncbi:unnamed protein product [Rhizophagus irregularis]|nr:unnamed protein product [Rhizophagus irregularis]CAB5394277.1 unnamed protein product [Rhizophagus irregularis]